MLISSLIKLDATKKENMLLLVCSESVESKHISREHSLYGEGSLHADFQFNKVRCDQKISW